VPTIRFALYRCCVVVLLCSLAVLDPRVGHTMDVLSPFRPISVLCHSDCAVSILVISNRTSSRELSGKIVSVYFISKYVNILALEMVSHAGNRHCASCIGTLSSAICTVTWPAYTFGRAKEIRATLSYRGSVSATSCKDVVDLVWAGRR